MGLLGELGSENDFVWTARAQRRFHVGVVRGHSAVLSSSIPNVWVNFERVDVSLLLQLCADGKFAVSRNEKMKMVIVKMSKVLFVERSLPTSPLTKAV